MKIKLLQLTSSPENVGIFDACNLVDDTMTKSKGEINMWIKWMHDKYDKIYNKFKEDPKLESRKRVKYKPQRTTDYPIQDIYTLRINFS